ncbi:MAG: YHS domain-containing protein [Ignavibacterium sp.]|jgi:YHS domain-containing protein|nr:YHS domain-containing protein [Ignavibacterium sp.]
MKNNTKSLRDPVCKKKVNPNKAYAKVKYGKEIYYLCCPLCQAEFEKDPDKFINNLKK